uniref:Uncharacterized protein n=1 Tax=Oryza nivara TaxID=4536 RepID=A0A0E0FKY2_ORYNI
MCASPLTAVVRPHRL